ncbi:hypothetical protein VE02_04043 [Pseudogymnoascus sp. 03VT05]|nr:hypothetical protein VE02_04043 [Pseudogymnoascus sp. 03VT05]
MCRRITLVFSCGCRKPSTIKTCGYVGQNGHKVFDTGKTKAQWRLCDECYIANQYGFCGCEAWEGEGEEAEEEEVKEEDEEEEEKKEEDDGEEEEKKEEDDSKEEKKDEDDSKEEEKEEDDGEEEEKEQEEG